MECRAWKGGNPFALPPFHAIQVVREPINTLSVRLPFRIQDIVDPLDRALQV